MIYRADRVLLPGGWASDVYLEIRADGYLGRVGGLPEPTAAVRIPGIVIPGVPNAHSHAFQRGLVGRAEKTGGPSDDFWGWRSVMYRFLQQLDPEDIEALAAQVYVEMLEAGYTSVAEFHYLHRDRSGARYSDPSELSHRMVRAAATAGIRMTLLPTIYTRGGFGDGPLEGGQVRFRMDAEGALETIGAVESSSAGAMVHTGLALHSLRAVGLPQMRQALAGFARLGSAPYGRVRPVHIHVAEQTGEVRACLRWAGARPVDYLLDHASVDATWCLVHATHLNDAEVGRLAASRAVVGLCPTTEANLGDGLFRLQPYLAAGGAWGIGSDSQVSVSPTDELRMLEYGQRLRLRKRNLTAAAAGGRDGVRSSGRALLSGAWEGGTRAVGQEAGAFAPGRVADLIVLDPDHPSLVGLTDDDVLDAWVFAGSRSAVRDVMVGGTWVVTDGRHRAADRITDRFRATMRRLA